VKELSERGIPLARPRRSHGPDPENRRDPAPGMAVRVGSLYDRLWSSGNPLRRCAMKRLLLALLNESRSQLCR
jgi:hypothetical protein